MENRFKENQMDVISGLSEIFRRTNWRSTKTS